MESIVHLFENALNPNNEIGEAARQKILEFQQQDLVQLINISAQIILSDEVSLLSQQYSFVILCQAFRPTSEMPVNQLRTNYTSLDESIKGMIRQAFIRGLMFEQREIYAQASLLVALITVIDSPDQSSEIFKVLNIFLMSDQYNVSVHFAAVLAYREIYNSGYLRNLYETVPDFRELLIQQAENLFNFLRNPVSFPMQFISEVLLTVSSLISATPFFFQQEAIQNDLYSILGNLFPIINDTDMFRNAFYVLLSLVKSNNDQQTLDISKIIELTSNALSCTNPDFVSICIDFWIEVLIMETSIMDDIDAYDRREKVLHEKFGKIDDKPRPFETILNDLVHPPRKYNEYAIQFAQHSFEALLQILFKIDPNDTTIEIVDEDGYLPHMYAYEFIKKVYPLAQEPIFNAISSIAEQMISSDNWVNHHGLLLALSCISDKITDEVQQLFMNCSQFLAASVTSENDKLSETALFALVSITKNSMIFSTPDNFPVMIQLIETCIPRHILIVKRSLEVLRNLIEQLSIDNEKFEKMICILIEMLKRPDILEDDLIFYVYDTIHCLITQSCYNSIELVVQFLQENILGFLEKTISTPSSQQLYLHQKCVFNTIGCIYQRFKFRLKDVTGIVMSRILDYSEQHNGDIIEDIMLAITQIIPALDDYLAAFEPKLMAYIDYSFSSQSPSIIDSAISVVTKLCQVDVRYAFPKIDDVINIALECIKEKRFTPDFYPRVAKNLSFIIEDICRFERKEQHPEFDRVAFRDAVFEFYATLCTLPLNFETENGNEFGNLVLEAELLGLSAVLQFSKDDKEFMKLQKNWIFDPLNLFRSLRHIFDDTHLAFLKFIEIAMDKLPPNMHVLIGKNLPASIFISALVSSNPKVSTKANKLYDRFSLFFCPSL